MQIFELLKDCVGLSIQQVGDIDLGYTLWLVIHQLWT